MTDVGTTVVDAIVITGVVLMGIFLILVSSNDPNFSENLTEITLCMSRSGNIMFFIIYKINCLTAYSFYPMYMKLH